MIGNDELNSKNFTLYAAKNYTNKRVLDVEEFYEDLSSFKYIQKLFTRYDKTSEIKERLVLNHLINIYNVFNFAAATKMLFFKLDSKHHPSLKTFLIYLNYIKDDDFINIHCDLYITKKLQKI